MQRSGAFLFLLAYLLHFFTLNPYKNRFYEIGRGTGEGKKFNALPVSVRGALKVGASLIAALGAESASAFVAGGVTGMTLDSRIDAGAGAVSGEATDAMGLATLISAESVEAVGVIAFPVASDDAAEVSCTTTLLAVSELRAVTGPEDSEVTMGLAAVESPSVEGETIV